MRWYVQASLDQVDSARACSIRALISKRFSAWILSTWILIQKNQSPVQLYPRSEIAAVDGGRLNANLEGTRAASNMMLNVTTSQC